MSVARWGTIISCLCLAPPVAAQSAASGASAVPTHPAAPAPAQTSGSDVVVNAILDKRTITWKRAESAHVILIGKGSDAELIRVTKNLERLHQLLTRLYRHGETADPTLKPQIVLVDSAADFRALGLRDLRAAEGPYAAAVTRQSYYDPGENGETLVLSRSGQIIDLDTVRAKNRDCDDTIHEGATDCTGAIPDHAPAARSWEELLYAAFAERFIQTYDPAVYPRWYLDGIGALFSTIRIKPNGSIEYGRPPLDYRQAFRSYGDINLGDVLAGHYLTAAPGKPAWTPYHAWLITHYFLLSDLKPEWGRQFRDYMAAIHQGQSPAEASKAFHDIGRLQRAVISYADSAKPFTRALPPATAIAEPTVTPLMPASAALVEARVELATRLASLQADAAAGVITSSPADTRAREAWLAQIRATVAQQPYDTDAMLFAAEAECRAGHPAECLADAERVLARTPDDATALGWKGVALTDLAVLGPAADRTAGLAAARRSLARAIATDGEAPLPLIARFLSFTKAGEPVPDDAMLGMAKVIRLVPAAPAPRLYLAEELLRQGQADAARRVAHTVLYGAYDSPEKTAATALFASSAGSAGAGR